MREIPVPAGISLDAIEWRLCHASGDYEVSEYGHVRRRTPGRRTFPGKLLSFCWHHAGYPRFKITINGKNKAFEAHRLVAMAFLGPPSGDRNEVAHGDGDPRNTHYSNLSWKTRAENESDKIAHGTIPAGTKNGGAKLNDDLVLKIRARRMTGASLTTIGREFGVAFQTISKIVNRKSWSHI
ncbi:HNH endonuclease [Pseudomonas paralactis]|uniref:HNH endonuclease n=1 Tax=Pseudomonas paralactis TaxID=1615673 RepID=UPI0016464688|nr:HNH endonuclease [Pseudomonas paralactis]MBC3254411.1 HNH endonuclease [Pseudomonas paralactis]